MLVSAAPAAAQAAPTLAPAEAPVSLADAERALNALELERALTLATAYRRTAPADPRGHVMLARVHLARRDPEAAYLSLQDALDAAPSDVDTLYYLGTISAELARRAFERLEEIAPDSARLRQLMAESLEARAMHAAAEREYEAALAKQPDLLDALLGLAKLKRIRLACDEAVALYARAETVRPTFEGAYGLGVCLSTQHDHGAALVRFEQAVARSPKSAVAWLGLGKTLHQLGRWPEAVAGLERAIAIEPGMAEAHYALGQALRAAGDGPRAAVAFRKAEALGQGAGPR